ncbi:MAG: carbamoyltransferase HypF [Anaerolineales bacterium]|nr:carbamoyltransferase HypF [Anaerolineales bacterium]
MNTLLASPPSSLMARRRLRVTGVVQGVGFRPFVYGLAHTHGLAGWVGNNSAGVFIEIEGPLSALENFQTDLTAKKPPLAHIEAVSVEALEPDGTQNFRIVESEAQPAANTLISPDIALCDDCLRELFDVADRRYRYPFINCTNCGPRFTLIQDIPYDRPKTTMAAFAMCPACQAEYHNPLNRRFHAQPNACPKCGPRLWLETRDGTFREDALEQTQRLLAQGQIVAIKGIGGFHLACDAANDSAVQLLRERKGRVDKPFAIMATNLEAVREFAEVNAAEAELLTSKERPIVLLRRKAEPALSSLLAPGNPYLGVMLPYSPLHHLLLKDRPSTSSGRGALVMTSGNYSDEPIAKDNAEARERLAALADAFLLHDRDIQVPCDDSVLRVTATPPALLPIRRSRGYAPFPVKLPFTVPPTLAVGGELKATFCLARDDYAFMSQHIGDMENLETLQAFERAVEHYQALFRCQPRVLVSDLHPRYLSSRWAAQHANGFHHIQVQHHHAHIAAVMAENGYAGDKPVIGFSLDGTGFGTDGAIWGGEVLLADYANFERAAHLAYVPLPGGDAAVKRPYRVALAHLQAAGVEWQEDLPPVAACPPEERRILVQQLRTGLQTVPTSSFGRLFDAVAALCGVRQTVTYEAQAASELEALAADENEAYAFELGETSFLAAPVIRAIAADLRAKVPVARIASRFHNAVAELILTLSQRLRHTHNLNVVALSGGVFQNVTLLTRTLTRLHAHNFQTLTHHLVPPNDGGLALGQAVIGAKRIVGSK